MTESTGGDRGREETVRTCRVKRSTLVSTYLMLAVLTLLTVIGIIFFEPQALFVVFLAYPLWKWYQLLRIPTEIRLTADASVEFRSPSGRVVLAPEQITQVKRVGRGYWLEYAGGSLNLYGDMEGFQEVLARLRAVNPKIELTTFTFGKQN